MANDDMKISAIRTGDTAYTEKSDKEKETEFITKPSYNNVGGGPSIWNDHLAFTKTNGVAGDNGESTTCFYS